MSVAHNRTPKFSRKILGFEKEARDSEYEPDQEDTYIDHINLWESKHSTGRNVHNYAQRRDAEKMARSSVISGQDRRFSGASRQFESAKGSDADEDPIDSINRRFGDLLRKIDSERQKLRSFKEADERDNEDYIESRGNVPSPPKIYDSPATFRQRKFKGERLIDKEEAFQTPSLIERKEKELSKTTKNSIRQSTVIAPLQAVREDSFSLSNDDLGYSQSTQKSEKEQLHLRKDSITKKIDYINDLYSKIKSSANFKPTSASQVIEVVKSSSLLQISKKANQQQPEMVTPKAPRERTPAKSPVKKPTPPTVVPFTKASPSRSPSRIKYSPMKMSSAKKENTTPKCTPKKASAEKNTGKSPIRRSAGKTEGLMSTKKKTPKSTKVPEVTSLEEMKSLTENLSRAAETMKLALAQIGAIKRR